MEVEKRPQHRRNQSSKSSILKALVSPKSRPAPTEPSPATVNSSNTDHSRQPGRGVLGERQCNAQSPPSSPRKSTAQAFNSNKDTQGTKVPTRCKDGSKVAPKKSKSSTNLAAVFAKMNRSTKDLTAQLQKDKENKTPDDSTSLVPDPPIWAQYASQSGTQSMQLDDRERKNSNELQDEIDRYTPTVYSPSKQHNFNGSVDQPHARPTLTKDRPRSTHVTGADSFLGNIGRRFSGISDQTDRKRSLDINTNELPPRSSKVSMEKTCLSDKAVTNRKTSGSSGEQAPPKEKLNITKRGGRVMAAVAAFQGRSKEVEASSKKEEAHLDPQAIDAAFEAVLESRNIPEPMREKMRTLTLRVKADFIKQDQGSKSPPSSMSSALEKSKSTMAITEVDDEVDNDKSTKRSRPRSRTFTWSKGDKKNKGDGTSTKKQRSQSRSRPISIEIPGDAAVKGQQSNPNTPTGSFGRQKSSSALPGDYIGYLRKNQDPTKVEVGRLHKLRILLRNETVAWVDSFISQDGMTEVVGLLHRIMGIEWREDHEDQLLHETLLCLKGLCTTERALAELTKVAQSLFPALLAMLFDEEKKGPAEYSTRAIIMNVLFTFLTSAINESPAKLEARAREILGYVGEPQKAADDRPLEFVLEMRAPRPYKLWSTEVSNVTKEVFWIFLHHLNVVPLPKPSSSHSNVDTTETERVKALQTTYTRRNFPGTRPPVPAAPYIGGVEWDATTYITAHIDLMNGLIASLPTPEGRNALRQELQASGFEKTMGTVLRTCKEKFYSGVHDGLRAWVAAAAEDGWDTRFVREGPTEEEIKEQAVRARSASPKKNRRKDEEPPKLDAPVLDSPKLDLDLKLSKTKSNEDDDDAWLG